MRDTLVTKIGAINMNGLNDIVFLWALQSLISKLRNRDVEFIIPIFENDQSNYEKLPLPIANLVSEDREFDVLLVFGAGSINSDWALMLSELNAKKVFLVCGNLPDADVVSTNSKFEYALGQTVDIISFQSMPSVLSLKTSAYVSLCRGRDLKSRTNYSDSRITILDTSKDSVDFLFKIINFGKNYSVNVITNGKTRQTLMGRGITIPIHHYSEVTLESVLSKSGVLLDFSAKLGGDLHKYFLIACADAGIPLLVRPSLGDQIKPLDCYPVAVESPNIFEVAGQLRDLGTAGTYPRQSWVDGLTLLEQKVETCLPDKISAVKPARSIKSTPSRESTIWMAPINGSGLGHVKRLVNISHQINGKIKGKTVRFCSFGGAIDSVSGLGFDVVPLVKHISKPGNRRVELLNYRRLNLIIGDEDTFVYDGGFPYDSVTSIIEGRGLKNSVWIRRGLFRADQDNKEALSREKYFSSIILPLEIFDELNLDGHAFGLEETRVSPILDIGEYEEKNFDLPFKFDPEKRLIVTMLGGGDTREVEGEIFAICDELSNFDDIIHIVMDWPKSRYTDAAWNFANTHIIKTMHASYFIGKADLVISAAGYNSFNEITYSRTPVIFVPQSAPWLDDQMKRAVAAQDREVAYVCQAGDYLRLRAELRRIIGSGYSVIDRLKANARKLELPEPGNEAAARIIAGMGDNEH